MVTAYGRDDLLPQARAVGIAEILAKPVTASTLFDTVMAVLSRGEPGNQPSLAQVGLALGAEIDLSGIAGARILLVEDNDLNQEVACALLGDAGLQVEVAENGAVALEKLDREHFDLVLMDMQMPVMDGLTATLRIREQPRFATLPILAMTANALSGDRERSLAAGMNDHLVKPIDPQQLFAALKQWIAPGERVKAVSGPVPEPASPASQLAALGAIEGLDLALGLRLARGREPLYLSLLRRFIARQGDFDAFLDAALRVNDYDAAERLAHTLKGVAGQIGAQNVRALAQLLEQAIHRREAPEVYRALREQIAEQLSDLIRAVQVGLPEVVAAAAEGEPDPQRLRQVCTDLARQLAADDFTALHWLESNHSLLRHGLAAYYPQIAAAIEDFEFAYALEILKKAAQDCGFQL